jgi:hypothetical protein
MFSSLHRKSGAVRTNVNGPVARRPRRSQPALESLEGRQLLSTVGGETQVNPVTSDLVYESATASSSNGSSVVVWVDNYYNTGDTDIWAQLYNASGAKVGGALKVDYTTAISSNPSVAMDSQGDFVVTWVNRGSSSDPHGQVMAEYFRPNGNTTFSGAFPVFYGGGATSMDHPVVAMNGNTFVVAFEQYRDGPLGLQTDIDAMRYAVTPGLDGPVIDTNPADNQYYWVDTSGGANKTNPSIAMSPNGDFDVAYARAWMSSPGSSSIMDVRYHFNGEYDTTFQISGPGDVASHPAVARDNLGNAVVAYQVQEPYWGTGIYARRISSVDTLYSGEIYVDDRTGDENLPSVAMEPSGGVGGGRFVVSYDTLNSQGYSAVGVAEISSQSSGSHVTTYLGGFSGYQSNVSLDASGNFQVTYGRNVGPAGNTIFLRRGTL